MRIISRKRLQEAAATHPKAKPTIDHWHDVAKSPKWTNLVETKATFSHADQVKVKSGNIVTVFNLTNDFRLITAIHYRSQIAYMLRVLTHAEYDKDDWKKEL